MKKIYLLSSLILLLAGNNCAEASPRLMNYDFQTVNDSVGHVTACDSLIFEYGHEIKNDKRQTINPRPLLDADLKSKSHLKIR